MQKTFVTLTAVSALCLLLLAGCMGRSQPPKFYTLSPLKDGADPPPPLSDSFQGGIGLGPVELADYLDQSRIVTRGAGNRVELALFDQWTGSIRNRIATVLADNLSYLLSTERIFLYPWRSYNSTDRRVELFISRFDGELDGEAVVIARWQIIAGKDKQLATARRSEIHEPTDAPGYEGLVAAQSRALARLSLEIAKALEQQKQQ